MAERRLELKGLTARACATMPAELWNRALRLMNEAEAEAMDADWPYWAREEQLPPPGDWRVWLMLAGRGFARRGPGRSGCVALPKRTARRGSLWSSRRSARRVR